MVGDNRSGTTLLRHVLNGHDRVWITRETHYFDLLRPSLEGDPASKLAPSDARRCEEHLLAVGRRGDSAVDPAELRERAAAAGGSADAYFEAFCRLQTEKRGKQVWGEKTPRHVFRLADMVGSFPAARIVCLVRDPRAVVASVRDFWRDERQQLTADEGMAERARKATSSYDLVLSSLLWNATVRAGYDGRNRFGGDRVYIQRYEDLVTAPEDSVRQLSEWLGIDYQQSMLQVRVVASSYATTARREGLQSEPLDRWREKLTPAEVSVVQTCCGRSMTQVGYSRADLDVPFRSLAWTWMKVPASLLRATVANRGRLRQAFGYGRERLRALADRKPLAAAGERSLDPAPGSRPAGPREG